MQLIKIFNFVLMATNRTTFFSLKCLQTQGDIIKTNTKHNLSYKTNQVEKKKKTKTKTKHKTPIWPSRWLGHMSLEVGRITSSNGADETACVNVNLKANYVFMCVCASPNLRRHNQNKNKTQSFIYNKSNYNPKKKKKKKKNTSLTTWVTRLHFLGGGEDNK